MVTLLTDYLKQRRSLNSADDISDIEWHNGDEVLLMDMDSVLIYSEEDGQWYPVPTGGGGGGGYTLLQSGTYTLATNVTGNNNMDIPITNIPDTNVIGYMCVVRESIKENTDHFYSWYRAYEKPNEAQGVTYVITGRRIKADGTTSVLYAETGVSTTLIYIPSGNQTLRVRPTGAYAYAGTYKWYIWGKLL